MNFVHQIQIYNQSGGILIPERRDKRWGYEEVFVNGGVRNTEQSSTYCMKAIHILPNMCTSKHYHISKHETLYVSQGILLLEYQNGIDADSIQITLPKGSTFVIPPGLAHKLINPDTEELIIVEASTQDNEKDSIRINL